MKYLIIVLLSTLCVSQAVAQNSAEAGEPLGLGVDLENFDRSHRPQDDFYRFVNGKWLEQTRIPADKSNYGAFTELQDRAEADLREIVEEAAAADAPKGSELRKIGDFYESFLDTVRVEQLGMTPVDGQLRRVAAIENLRDLASYIGANHRRGLYSPFGFYISQDGKNAEAYISYLTQSGLGLPDRDYYFDEGERFAQMRAAYKGYIERLFTLAGRNDGAAAAEAILDLETEMARRHWTRVQNRDRDATYNRYDLASASEMMPRFDFGAFFDAAGIAEPGDFVVRQPTYFASMDTILAETPLETWKQYLTLKALSDAAPYLNSDFVEAGFDFYGRTLSGMESLRPRWKRGISAVEGAMGEAVGKVYVERHFSPDAKARVENMVRNLSDAFGASIDDLDWMDEETRVAARKKLSQFTFKIGYPDRWKDYSGLVVRDDDLFGNVLRARAHEYNRDLAKLGQPVDRDEWFMTPQTVNAYYNPAMNEVVFPAAILQPPFFNVEAEDAVNYGGIGAVIGHEFSHGFDDQGRKYDGEGNLRDWWTAASAERFEERAARLAAQYGEFSPIDSMNVNGELTLGENIADLAGLTMAHRAYLRSLDGRESPVIEGFTGSQRVFLGWAQVWRRKYRDDELRRRLLTDPHSPSEYRANGTVMNMPEFYAAFGVEEGDVLYRPPEERVKIW